MLGPTFSLGGKATPAFYRGDFDGDGKADLAVEVCHSGDQGLAVFLSSRKAPIIIAAGKPYFAWAEISMDFDTWSIYPKTEQVEEGPEAGPPPKLKGDALMVGWSETSSGLIYWTGKKFEWYQQGD